jgi:hypothetical protein
MQQLKTSLKLVIGIAVIVLVAVLFLFMNKSGNLENGNLKHWAASGAERRAAAVKILTGGEEHTDLMVACLNKMASLPDSADMPLRDAASLCYTGIQLKEHI